MKKVKIVFWLIMLGLLVLVVFQNQDFFLTKHSLSINLGFTQRTIPEAYNLLIIVAFFGLGVLIAYVSSLFERFKANKTIKELRHTINSHQETIAQMRREVDALKTPADTELTQPTMDDTKTEAPEAETAETKEA